MKKVSSDIIRHIKLDLERISKFDVHYIISDPEWKVSFSEKERQITQVVKDCKLILDEFSENPVFFLDKPVDYLDDLRVKIEELWNSLRNMRNFIDEKRSILSTDEYGDRSIETIMVGLKKTFDERHNAFVSAFSPIISTVTSNIVLRNKSLKEDNVDLTVGTENDIQELYLTVFDDRAKGYKKSCNKWLSGIGVTIFLSVSYAICLTIRFENGKSLFGLYDYLNFFDHVALRVILFSLIAYALHFMSRAYSINKKQQIYNEDRAAALECFPRFMRTSIRNDPELHRAIMVQITKSIFESRDNVYSDDKGGEKIVSAPRMTLSLSKND